MRSRVIYGCGMSGNSCNVDYGSLAAAIAVVALARLEGAAVLDVDEGALAPVGANVPFRWTSLG